MVTLMASSNSQRVSSNRRSTPSSKTPAKNVVARNFAVDSRNSNDISSQSTRVSGSAALKQTVGQACARGGERASTQLFETELRSSMTASPSGNSTPSSRNYISDVEERLQTKLQGLYSVERVRVNSSVSDSPKMTTPSPLTPLISVSQEFPAQRSFRMLLSVTLLGTIWEVRVIMNAQETVKDVIKAALVAFSREGRKLFGGSPDHAPEAYELYLSPFSLQYLEMDAKIMDVGARSFVLRRKKDVPTTVVDDANSQATRWWSLLSGLWR